MRRSKKLACSFCGKDDSQVAKLVAGPKVFFGPKVFICDRCVAIASRIMEDSSDDPSRPQEPRRGFLLRLWSRVRPSGWHQNQLSETPAAN